MAIHQRYSSRELGGGEAVFREMAQRRVRQSLAVDAVAIIVGSDEMDRHQKSVAVVVQLPTLYSKAPEPLFAAMVSNQLAIAVSARARHDRTCGTRENHSKAGNNVCSYGAEFAHQDQVPVPHSVFYVSNLHI